MGAVDLALLSERGWQVEQGDQDEERDQGKEGEVFGPGPALIAVGKALAAGFGAGLGGGQGAAEHDAGKQRE